MPELADGGFRIGVRVSWSSLRRGLNRNTNSRNVLADDPCLIITLRMGFLLLDISRSILDSVSKGKLMKEIQGDSVIVLTVRNYLNFGASSAGGCFCCFIDPLCILV